MAKKKVQAVVELGPASFEDSTFFNDGDDSRLSIVGESTLDDVTDPQNSKRLFTLATGLELGDNDGVHRASETDSRMPRALRARILVRHYDYPDPALATVFLQRAGTNGFLFTAHVRLKAAGANWKVHVTAIQYYNGTYTVREMESAALQF